jgi:glutaminase
MTGEIAYDPRAVKDVLSIMFRADATTRSVGVRVGVPAKSGVGGGIIAVVNRRRWASGRTPRLDTFGNGSEASGVRAAGLTARTARSTA